LQLTIAIATAVATKAAATLTFEQRLTVRSLADAENVNWV